jgi:hypothetical protein
MSSSTDYGGALAFLLSGDQMEKIWMAGELDLFGYVGFNLPVILQAVAKGIAEGNKTDKVNGMKLIIAVAALRGPRACFTGSISNDKLSDAAQEKLAKALQLWGIENDNDKATATLKSDELTPQRLVAAAPHLAAAALIVAKRGGKIKGIIGDAQAHAAAVGAGIPWYLMVPGMSMLLLDANELDYYLAWVKTTAGKLVARGSTRSRGADPQQIARAAFDNRELYGTKYVTEARKYLEALDNGVKIGKK